jgi:phage tail sheath protein FI
MHKKGDGNCLAMSRFSIRKPGVYIKEVRVGPQSIVGVSTDTAAFFGETQKGPDEPTLVTSWAVFQSIFGGYFGQDKYLPFAVEGFFANGGQKCYVCRVVNGDYAAAVAKTEQIEDISLVYSPNAQATAGLVNLIIDHCERLRNRFAIFDSLKGQEPQSITKPRESSFAALYYPWVYVKQNANTKVVVPPGGHIVGIYARIDNQTGVHKAPANQEIKGITGEERSVSNLQQETLNPRGINCIRSFVGRGILVWGARTLSGDAEYRYINVRRLLICLEQSIKRGTAWAAFEPNKAATWAKVKLQTENFLMKSWKEGKLQGIKPEEAYFVKCDRTTMTQSDIDAGRLIVEVGVATVKPAEFMIIRVSQTLKH